MNIALRELTEQEKRKPFAKFFYKPMSPAPQDSYDAIKDPIDPKDALLLSHLNKLLDPGYLPCEKGFCLMPDGTGFIAMMHKMPGVTIEMIEWWFMWHGLESLRYSIWCPDDHLGIHVKPEDIERRLNTNLSYRERNWNTTDVVYEDIGTGPITLDISFMSPEEFGYDMSRFKEPNALGAVNANIFMHDTQEPLVCFSHFVREIDGGIEMRSRFWLGMHVVDKKPVVVNNHVPLELVKGLAAHCPKEYANLANILPSVFNENKDNVDKIEDFKN